MFSRVLRPYIVLIPLAFLSTNAWGAENATDDFVQSIVKLIGDSDREFRAAGLEQVRTSVKGAAATKVFSAQLKKLDAAGQIALINALADRGDQSARGDVIELLESSKDERVRSASIVAVGRLGSVVDLPLLVKSLSSESHVERVGARQGLVQIRGDAINSTLAGEIKTAAAKLKSELIDVLATRRASSELPAIVAAAIDDDTQVRNAAMSALGQIGRSEQIPSALQGILKAQKGGERDNAEKNVALICSRIENEDQRGTRLIEAINAVAASERDELLPLVGRVGGKKLINYVGDFVSETDASRRQLGIDALSKWPDASVADKLLEIVNTATDPLERKQAFQGYIKVCASRDGRSDKERLDRMKQAMKVANSSEEQTLVINRTRTAYDVESVRFVVPYLDQAQFAEITCETIVEIAHHREVRDHNKAEFDKVLDKVIETTKDPVVVDRAQRYKRGETWERPKK